MIPISLNRRWLGFELSVLRRLKFASIAIPFAGRPDLDWYLKFWGKQILNNDLCQWSWWMSRALVENQGAQLSLEEVERLLSQAYVPRRHLHNPALGQLMGEMDACWFDNLWLGLQEIEHPHARALGYLHALAVGDYASSFMPEAAELRRPLSEVFTTLWRAGRQVISNGQANQCANLDAQEFIRGVRADLMFARFPRPSGLAAQRRGAAGRREIWARGTGDCWEALIEGQRGRLGESVLAKESYLQLVGNFLARATHIPKWAIAHAEDGFLTAAEVGELVKAFRPVEVIYSKDFSDVLGGLRTYIIVAG